MHEQEMPSHPSGGGSLHVKNWHVAIGITLVTLLSVAIGCTLTAIWTEDDRWARTAELFWIMFCGPPVSYAVVKFFIWMNE